jgi:hypothetical protein
MPALSVQCGNCELPLLEDCSEQHRQPCPGWRSIRRIFNHAGTEITYLEKMWKMKIKTPSFLGKGHIRVEQRVGDDLHRRSARWFKKERIIDRKNDRYFEKIADPETGCVIHHCDEPLTQHFGHGSAKR